MLYPVVILSVFGIMIFEIPALVSHLDHAAFEHEFSVDVAQSANGFQVERSVEIHDPCAEIALSFRELGNIGDRDFL
jgi:hypothetical protein